MVNKPVWHITDFVLASYTFGCVKMSDFVPNNRHLREVFIFFSFEENGGWNASRTQKSLRRCCSKYEGRPKIFEDTDVIYYELLKPNETITGERYLQHDNARPNVAKPVKTYLETLKWEVLSHPPYSPDIAPSDYYLFRSKAHGLAD